MLLSQRLSAKNISESLQKGDGGALCNTTTLIVIGTHQTQVSTHTETHTHSWFPQLRQVPPPHLPHLPEVKPNPCLYTTWLRLNESATCAGLLHVNPFLTARCRCIRWLRQTRSGQDAKNPVNPKTQPLSGDKGRARQKSTRAMRPVAAKVLAGFRKH